MASAAEDSEGWAAVFERDEVVFEAVPFDAVVLALDALDVAAFVAFAFDEPGALAGVVCAAFGAAGDLLLAGAFFSTGAVAPADAAPAAVVGFRPDVGFAVDSADVDPVDGVVDAGEVVCSSLFAVVPFRGRLFDVIASLSPLARPIARTRARQVELRPVAA